MEAMKLFFRSHELAGIAAIVLGVVILAFPLASVAQNISDECLGPCHEHSDIHQKWKVSGHPYKLMKADIAQNRPIPLPEGYTWDEISYVIGGYKWKSRYMDLDGYIITQDKSDAGGNTQYNYLTGNWVDYNADKDNGVKPYDCGRCHTTGWVANDNPEDLDGNQGNLPGIHGTFEEGGIQCVECHGGSQHADFGNVDSSAAACGRCHYRDFFPPDGDDNVILASGGFIRHHEQFNEHLAGPHAGADCVACHDPHAKSEFSIKANCADCHPDQAAAYAMTSMYDYEVTCEDCHMPFASKSAEALGPNQGDVMTHIFYINTEAVDRSAMFEDDGGSVALDEDGKAMVTMDFACQRCHETATLEELSKFAEGFHERSGPLDGIGIDPGLSGHWWDSDREGEGFMMEIAYVGDDLFLFVSFYAYDAEGNRTYLFAQGFADGTSLTVPVTIVLPEGGSWGADFDEADVMRPEWGSGTFTFGVDCETADFDFTANQAALDAGYTDITGSLTRDLLEVGIACPTFVNNAGDMAAAQ